MNLADNGSTRCADRPFKRSLIEWVSGIDRRTWTIAKGSDRGSLSALQIPKKGMGANRKQPCRHNDIGRFSQACPLGSHDFAPGCKRAISGTGTRRSRTLDAIRASQPKGRQRGPVRLSYMGGAGRRRKASRPANAFFAPLVTYWLCREGQASIDQSRFKRVMDLDRIRQGLAQKSQAIPL